MSDKFIDVALLYMPVHCRRDIKVQQICKYSMPSVELQPDAAIFINGKIYGNYCSKSAYGDFLVRCLTGMSHEFADVYFKFHPNEKIEDIVWQREIISKISNVHIIERSVPVEDLIEQYPCSVAVSVLSSALLSLSQRGVNPVFAFKLIKELRGQDLFVLISQVLDEMGYVFIKDFTGFAQAGMLEMQRNNCIEQLPTLEDVVLQFRDSKTIVGGLEVSQ